MEAAKEMFDTVETGHSNCLKQRAFHPLARDMPGRI